MTLRRKTLPPLRPARTIGARCRPSASHLRRAVDVIRLTCLACRAAYTLPDTLLGKRVRCSKCKKEFEAKPAPEEEVVDLPAPADEEPHPERLPVVDEELRDRPAPRLPYCGTGDLYVYKVDERLRRPIKGTTVKPPKPDDGELRPAAVVKLASSVPALVLSPDRRWVYLLNASDGKVRRIDTGKRALDAAAAELRGGAEGMCASPDGKTLYAFASLDGHRDSHPDGNRGRGEIHVVDAAALKVSRSFTVYSDPYDMAANDAGLLFVTGGSNQQTSLTVVDAGTGKVRVEWGGFRQRSLVRLSADQKRLYVGTTDVGTTDVMALVLPGKVEDPKPARYASPYKDQFDGRPFVVSPDGKYLVSALGYVLSLSAKPEDDLKLAAKVEKHVACAMDRDCDRVLIATADGWLKAYSYPKFEPEAAMPMGAVAYRMVLDAGAKTLYCAVDANKKPEGVTFRGNGDVYVHEVGALLKAPGKGK